jgi:hypothetical protein
VSDNSSNIHRAINVFSITDKELKKYKIVKTGATYQEGDLILLYENIVVKINENSQMLKHKISKDNTVYRKIV